MCRRRERQLSDQQTVQDKYKYYPGCQAGPESDSLIKNNATVLPVACHLHVLNLNTLIYSESKKYGTIHNIHAHTRGCKCVLAPGQRFIDYEFPVAISYLSCTECVFITRLNFMTAEGIHPRGFLQQYLSHAFSGFHFVQCKFLRRIRHIHTAKH